MIDRRELLTGVVVGAAASQFPATVLGATEGSFGGKAPTSALVGDSRLVTTFDFAAAAVQKSGQAFINWACALDNQRLNVVRDRARPGATTAEMLGAVAGALEIKPSFVHILGGVNSLARRKSAKEIAADLFA